MPLRETIGVAFQSMRANWLRASLTMLGIIIGVAAVIAMLALGTGARRAIEEKIDALGAQLLTIYPGQTHSHGVASAERVSLTIDDAEALARDASLLAGVLPELQKSLPVRYGSSNIHVAVVGTTPNFVELRNRRLRLGRSFTRGDEWVRRRVAVLGSAVPEMLDTEAESLLGESVSLGGVPFEVVGVLEEKGSEGSWFNPDEQIVIPLATAHYRAFGSDRLHRITVAVAEDVPVEQAMIDIERVLRREHKLRPGTDNDFRLRNRREILATQQEATRVFTYLLASIAAVSLFVGGIGILNIMLVSVTERTREIGIRKAVGAPPGAILLQFLVEALVLCLVGGLLGILLGAASALALSHLVGWNTHVSAGAVALAFSFSAAVGLFFGLWPARRAALLNPVEALRYE